jgi:molecular chaperone GrpE
MAKKREKKVEMEEKEANSVSEENSIEQEVEEGASEKNAAGDKFEELQRKYLLLYSDFDNFRKRSNKEKADIINSAGGRVISDLLVVLDDFERAIANNDSVDDVNALREGFKLIHTKFLNILATKGLESMNATGDVFDADKHEAITQIPVEDKDQKGKVVDVVERGYKLNGTVLRYAKVIVGQ